MSNTDQILTVSVEARINKLEREMKRASGVVGTNFEKMERRSQVAAQRMEANMAKAATGVGSAFTRGLGGMLGATGIGLSTGAIIKTASAWKDLKSRVDNAAGSMRMGADVMDRLATMADRTYSSIEQTTEAWLNNSTALTELGYNTTEQLDLIETLNNALVVSGARGQQAESVMNAWSKAMALGELRGENLNTVIQSGGRLAKALADSMGVSTNELRKLGMEGRITSRDMFAVTSQLEQLRTEADNMTATAEDGFLLVRNAVFRLIGEIDTATGSTANFANELVDIAAWVNDNRDGIVGFFAGISEGMTKMQEMAAQWRESVGIEDWLEGTSLVEGRIGRLSDQLAEAALTMEERVARARLAIADFASEIALLENVRDFAPHLPGDIEALIDKLLLGDATADETRAALVDLGTANPNFGGLIGQLSGLVAELDVVATAARNAANEIANVAGGPTGDGAGRGGAGASRRALIEKQGIGAAYITEQERLLTLSRDQLAVEQAIARIKRDVAEAGGVITDAEAEALARLQVAATQAATARSGSASSARDEADAVAELIEELRFEQSTLGMTETQKRTVELLRRAGAAATAQERQEIIDLVHAIETERNALQQLDDAMSNAKGIAKDFLGGIISDLRNGVSGAEALANAFGRLADRLIDMALDSLINSLFANLTGGLFGGLFGFSGGGYVGKGFAEGGYTGDGGKNQPKGVVHGGEYVFSKEATRRAGVANLDAMHRSLKGYAAGGLVGQAPAFRPANDNRASANGNAPVISINAPITVQGSAGTPAQNADLARQMGRQLEATMRGVVVDELQKQTRAGNMLNRRG